MELTIYRSIIFGELKPWLSNAVDDKYYRQNISNDFIQPKKTIDNYYKALKKLHPDKPNLYKDDGLEIYLSQKDTDIKAEILHPLIKVDLKPPVRPTQKFYHYLLKNETTRLTNRIFKCVNKDIDEIQKKEIVQNVVKSCKDLLLRIGTDQKLYPKTELSEYVIPQLITNVIRLLKETEFLYPHLLHDLPADKYTIYGELLQQPEVPDNIDIEEKTPEFTTIKDILLDNNYYRAEADNRFSFGYKGDIDNLKSVLTSLHYEIDLLDDNTSIEDLVAVLTSKDLQRGAKQIHLACETTQFSYLLYQIKHHFSNFNPTSIEKSELFYSKQNVLIKKGNLYNNKSKDPKKKEYIDSIIKHL